MVQMLKRVGVALVFGVAAFLPGIAQAQVSKFALNVTGKESCTIIASLAVAPAPGEIGELNGTVVPAGKLPPEQNNFTVGIRPLQGVQFTRLDNDTIKVVDAKGNKFWIMMKTAGQKVSASISDGTATLASGEFSGQWFNDTGEMGAQSIPCVLASVVASQTVNAGQPQGPTSSECLTAALNACSANGGLKSFKWISDGSCEFICAGRPAP